MNYLALSRSATGPAEQTTPQRIQEFTHCGCFRDKGQLLEPEKNDVKSYRVQDDHPPIRCVQPHEEPDAPQDSSPVFSFVARIHIIIYYNYN